MPAMPIHMWPVEASPPHQAMDAEIHVCSDCGHVQLQSMSAPLVATFYDAGVFVEDSVAAQQARLDVFRRNFGDDVLDGERVLDFGGGNNPFVGLIPGSERWISDIVISDEARAECDVAVEGDFASGEFPAKAFALVTAFHTLEHIPDPGRAVRKMAEIVAPDGIVMVEVPNAPAYVTALPHYAFFHQHQSYFTRATLDLMMQTNGFEPVACLREDIVLLCAYRPAEKRTRPIMAPERGRDLCTLRNDLVAELDARMREEIGDRKRFAVYGAGGSTTLLLCVFPWIRDRLRAVYDRALDKHGRFIPGTGVRVEAPEAMAASTADCLIFLSASLYDTLSPTTRIPSYNFARSIDLANAALKRPADVHSR